MFKDKVLVVTCPDGCGTFNFDCRKHIAKQQSIRTVGTILLVILVCVDIVLPLILWEASRSKTQRAKRNYDSKLARLEEDLAEKRRSLKVKYAAEVAAIDSNKLAKQAATHYAVLWKKRGNYSPQYALSPREKALLEMQALARDPTKNEGDIIRKVTTKAAPDDSQVVVSQTGLGFELSVDFDMSELTTGETGTRTKHSTIASLKKEVIRLTSQVADDVYEFCGDLDLTSISIGCRHFVRQHDESLSYVGDLNTLLYKVMLDATDLGEMRHNPYLDTYSITERFKVKLDNFSTLSIKTTTYAE